MIPLSIIVPVVNEEACLAATLDVLAPLRRRGTEVIVVDGGSRDRTVAVAREHGVRVISAPRGRAAQMNAGAVHASAPVLMFLHADTRLPAHADRRIIDGLAQSGRKWGRFDVRIAGHHPALVLVAALMNLRSRLTGIATGDQAIFVTRDAFTEYGGFPEIALMEDIALSCRLKRLGRPLCLRERVITSGRRWQQHGIIATVLLMWRLRLAYWRGADASVLAQQYGYAPRRG